MSIGISVSKSWSPTNAQGAEVVAAPRKSLVTPRDQFVLATATPKKMEVKQGWVVTPSLGAVVGYAIKTKSPHLIVGTIGFALGYGVGTLLGLDAVGEKWADGRAIDGDELYPGPHTNRRVHSKIIKNRALCESVDACVIHYDRKAAEAIKQGLREIFLGFNSSSSLLAVS